MTYSGYDKNFSLAGKTAVITGGAAGIGNAIAELFTAKGAQIALLDNSARVQQAAETLGPSAMGVKADVTASTEIQQATADIMQAYGTIDILVNCAGIVALNRPEAVSETEFDQIMAINLKGTFLMCQHVGHHMLAAGQGSIINMASQAANVALPGHLAYCTSKAGIVGMTRVLALEWGPNGIRSNAISPTVAMTELGQKAWAGDVGEQMKARIPSRRFVYPEEIAATALYLASDAAYMINGHNLVIDGGYSIQ